MKPIFTSLAIIALSLACQGAVAAPNPKVRGTVKDSNGESVSFCSVMFAHKSDSLNVRGDIANIEGYFEIPIPAGDYYVTVTLIGYEPFRKEMMLGEDTDLGTIVLKESAIQLEATVVRADMIRRKADGYLFTPSNSPIVTGRNSLELLTFAPGVWVDKDKGISINGKSGTKVMINDRVLQMSAEELSAYLESINAEDIRNIEVIPEAGAQYDADATGGILKITLKRGAMAGISGSVAMNFNFSDDDIPSRLRPSFNLDYRKNRLSLYSSFTFFDSTNRETDHEHTQYLTDEQREIDNTIRLKGGYNSYSGRIGSVYELTDRQSIGLDFDLMHSNSDQNSTTTGITAVGADTSDIRSRYGSKELRDRYNVSFNYKLKTDEKGSGLTVVADYMYNQSDNTESNESREIPKGGDPIVSHRNSYRLSQTDFYTVRADYKHYLNTQFQLNAGMKYAYTDMDTDIDYEDIVDQTAVPVEELKDHYLYREGVLAGYVNGTANLGRWNLIAGLRVENTNLRPHSFINPEKARKQNYTDFFPTVRAGYMIHPEKGHLINVGYNRRIRRPGFSQLNPYRIQLNNYTFIVGNPEMKPSYTDTYTLTGIVGNKYSLTLAIDDTKGAVNQIVIPDPDDPDILLYQHANVDRITNYTASLSAPFHPTGWWRMNIDATYAYSKNKLKTYELNGGTFRGRLNNLFTLPKGWSAELNYVYVSGGVRGNWKIMSFDQLNTSIKKNFFNNKLTTSIFVNNLLDDGKWIMHADIHEPGRFLKKMNLRNSGSARTYGISLRWNFRSGKEVKVQKVTAGNEEERSR